MKNLGVMNHKIIIGNLNVINPNPQGRRVAQLNTISSIDIGSRARILARIELSIAPLRNSHRPSPHAVTAFKMRPTLSISRLGRSLARSSVSATRPTTAIPRTFSSCAPSFDRTPPRGWTPTPFVTETVVCQPFITCAI